MPRSLPFETLTLTHVLVLVTVQDLLVASVQHEAHTGHLVDVAGRRSSAGARWAVVRVLAGHRVKIAEPAPKLGIVGKQAVDPTPGVRTGGNTSWSPGVPAPTDPPALQ